MRNGGFPVRAIHLGVEVHDPWGSWQGEAHHLLVGERLGVEVVVERPQLVVMGDEPQLSARVGGSDVRAHVAEDVLVVEHDRAVDLGLSGPWGLVAGEEDLDGNVFAVPCSAPHFAVTTFA